MSEETPILNFVTGAADAGKRLDAFLAEKIEDWSRSRLQRLIADADVLVNQKNVRSSYKLRQNDEIEVELTEAPPAPFEPEDIPLDVVFEDEYLAVINKPAGMIVHPGSGVTSGTLANAIAWHYIEPQRRRDAEKTGPESSPPYKGGVAAASADGVVLSAERKKRDWQNIDSSSFPGVFTLGVTETVIILGLLDALFLTFVVMQAPYLFGGMELVQNTPDFKLADYARRGFGELVAVAALVLPLLLLSHWLLRRQANRLETVFRVLAGIQVALVFVIMASAVQRLVLLTGVEGYGLTTVRFYPMVFMLWLAVVFAWFAVTVLRNARQNFAWGALWSAIVILGATNLMNPDAFIARTNIELMKHGRDFDALYNSQLSTDAVPELISALPEMKFEDQCRVKWELQKRYRDLEENSDPRSLNLSRRNSFYLLNDNSSQLDSMEDCPPNSVKEVIRPEETD